jgi:hypothetical protein
MHGKEAERLTAAAAAGGGVLQQAARLEQVVWAGHCDAHALAIQAQSGVQDATVRTGGVWQQGIDGEVDVLQPKRAEQGAVACSKDSICLLQAAKHRMPLLHADGVSVCMS